MSSPRYAIYYTPPPSAPLARFGARVLGYDCFEHVEVPHMALGRIDPAMMALMTVEPRRYGFHATLVAPFDLRNEPEDDLVDEFDAFASAQGPVAIGTLTASALGSFVALVPAQPNRRLSDFAGVCVEHFDRFRAPLSATDRERRVGAGLTPEQVKLLDRWGYPYVFDQFRFHMTLTGPLPADQVKQFQSLLSHAFSELAADAIELDGIALMRQDDRSSRFKVMMRKRLRGGAWAEP